MDHRLEELKKWLGKYSSAAIAFSGGVDSTFLARVARDVYGEKLLLVTATSSTYPVYELEEAKSLATRLQIRHLIINSEELDIPGFSENPPDRCFHCKNELFSKINAVAVKEGLEVVFDGSNVEDTGDYRPGMKAKKLHGVLSPLMETGFTKNEIRHFSRIFELPTAEKQSYACLSSRFPYGEKITREKLGILSEAELGLRKLGFTQFRIRSHENLARLEFIRAELGKAWEMRETLTKICRDSGFKFVTIDLEGYRTGAMNEALSEEIKARYK